MAVADSEGVLGCRCAVVVRVLAGVLAGGLVGRTASAQPAQPAPSAAAPTGSAPRLYTLEELPRGAWPGVSLEDLRGVRECTLEDPPMKVGAPVTCRPPVLPSPAHLSFELGWTTGFALGDNLRGVHGLSLDGAYWLTRSIGLGGRYALVGIATPDGMATGLAGEGVIAARVRLFTDEADRDAVTISAGAGLATRAAILGDSGPIARIAITRDTGYMTGETSSVTWAWELAFQQGLDAAAARTLTAGVRAGFELGIREPENLADKDTDPPLRSALGGEFRASPQVGVGASFDLPVTRALAWRTTGFWTTGHDDRGEHGLAATWAAVTGPRIMILPAGLVTPYLDVQGGPAWIDGDHLGALAEAEAGVEFHLGCQTRLDLGGRIQAEVDHGVDVRTGFFILRVSHGTALRHPGSDEECTDDLPTAR